MKDGQDKVKVLGSRRALTLALSQGERGLDEPHCNRREVLAGAARYAALAGISLLSARLLVKSAVVPGDESCREPGACRGCGALADCRLPAALLARQGERGE